MSPPCFQRTCRVLVLKKRVVTTSWVSPVDGNRCWGFSEPLFDGPGGFRTGISSQTSSTTCETSLRKEAEKTSLRSWKWMGPCSILISDARWNQLLLSKSNKLQPARSKPFTVVVLHENRQTSPGLVERVLRARVALAACAKLFHPKRGQSGRAGHSLHEKWKSKTPTPKDATTPGLASLVRSKRCQERRARPGRAPGGDPGRIWDLGPPPKTSQRFPPHCLMGQTWSKEHVFKGFSGFSCSQIELTMEQWKRLDLVFQES